MPAMVRPRKTSSANERLGFSAASPLSAYWPQIATRPPSPTPRPSPPRRSPRRACPRDQFVGDGGTPASGGIVREVRRRVQLPMPEQWVKDLPGRFRLVAAREQRRVAKHAIEQQRLIGVVTRRIETPGVVEIHV